MKSLLLILAVAVMGIPISACETTRYVTTSQPFKGSLKPICVSKDDVLTEGTAQAIEGDDLAKRSIFKSRDECKQPPAK